MSISRVSAAFIIIGNEILSGKVREENLVPLTTALRERGIRLNRVVVVPDDIGLIASEVRELASRFDYVFTSGGVGPTHDDVTMKAIATAFGVGLERDPRLEALLRAHHGNRLRDEHLIMADVPSGARMLSTSRTPWPVTVVDNVWILPGVPEVFRYKMPIVQEHLSAHPPFVSRAVYTNLEEAELKALLDETVAGHGDVDIGSYPKWEDPKYKTKITFDGLDTDAVDRAVDDFSRGLPEGEPLWTE